MSIQAVHQPSESFLKEVHAVAAAEAEAGQKITQATEKAAQIKAEAQAQAVKMSAAAADKAVAEKDKTVAEHRARAEAEVRKIMARAAERSKQLASRKLTDSAAAEIADSI
jgi:vacuolar-type H+-ATPase subunit H